MDFYLAAYTLWKREIVRFYRQPSRIIGALGTPLIFWIILGAGIGNISKTNYLAYFFPGTIVLVVFFTAIFSTFSIIDDRKEGFLQSVMVAPVSRGAIVMGKILGGATLAFIQGIIFLIFAKSAGAQFEVLPLVKLLIALFLISFAMTAMGFVLAWRMDSTQGFHAIMNLFLMPMWLVSGAVFPFFNAPIWLKILLMLNPLTYGVAGIRWGLYPQSNQVLHIPTFNVCAIVLVGVGFILYLISSISVAKAKRA